MKVLKKHCPHKNIIVCFYNLDEEIFKKLQLLQFFQLAIIVLFEIHQRFKGHFFKELRVSFKNIHSDTHSTMRTGE